MTFLNWSGGKDSAYCLYQAKQQGLSINALVTTLSRQTGRVSMHGLPLELVEAQAKQLGLPLYPVYLNAAEGGMNSYEAAIHEANGELKAKGFTQAASGDLFLEDLRAYRQQLYAKDGLETIFPIWGRDTRALIEDFITLGFQAVVVAVNESKLDPGFCGRIIDAAFLCDLPEGVDPCGENGEYHSFVFNGPGFAGPIAFDKGAVVQHEYPAPMTGDDCFTTPQSAVRFSFLEILAP